MKKQEMLDSIENAKHVHLDQMYKIASLIKGKEVKNPTPIGKMNCACGTWFYSNTQLMQEILGMQLFERLDMYHERWHNEYSHIYNIFFKNEKKGFFLKLLGTSGVSDMDLDKAKLYYTELQETTEELMKVSDSALRRVSAIGESKFSAL